MSDLDVSKIDVGWRVQFDATHYNDTCKVLHGLWGTVNALEGNLILIKDDLENCIRYVRKNSQSLLSARPPEPVKDPFAVGEWVVCVRKGVTTPANPGDIIQITDNHWSDTDWFTDGDWGYAKSRFRPATSEEIAAHLGEEREGMEKQTTHSAPPTGGLSGHYLAGVPEPQRGGPSYTAECDDIIFALNMTFDEGEAFKAIWRTCTSRLGYGKEGNTALYNAQKLVHRAGRILKREKGE